MSVHQNPDPMTGSCLDCGATREQIDDDLFPVCEKIEGPHRLAIIAVRQEMMRCGGMAGRCERLVTEAEDAIAQWTKSARALRDDERALAASLDLLRGDPSEKPLPLADAVRRLA